MLRDCYAIVTGATGFIGSRLSESLAAAGATVHALSRSGAREQAGISRWTRIDLCDLPAVRTVLKTERPDFVFHLASLVTGSRQVEIVPEMFRANLASAVNLLCAAAGMGGMRLVLAGSMEEPEGRSSGAIPCSPYAAAKWAASGYARMFHALYGTDVVTARIFMTYGPGQADGTKLVPYVVNSFLSGGSPRLASGRRKADWVYVDDVVEGLIRLAQRGGAGSTVELGTGRLASVREVVAILEDLMEPACRAEFGSIEDPPRETERAATLSPAREQLEWTPRVTLEEGLARTVAYYRSRRETAGAAGGGRG